MFSRFDSILCKFLLVLNCNCFYLVPFLAYSALNSWLGSCKVIDNGTIRKPGHGFLFALVIMAQCCIIAEIERDNGRKLRFFFIPTCIRRPR